MKASSKIADLPVVPWAVGAPGKYSCKVSSYYVRIIWCIVNLCVLESFL